MVTLQEPNFNSDSGDEAAIGKQRRVAAGDGKKPTIMKENPAFDAIYKNAILKLKRQIYFTNAFPAPVESDNLARKAYNYGVNCVTKSNLFSRDDLRGANKVFDGKWFSCVCTFTYIWVLYFANFGIAKPPNKLTPDPVENNNAHQSQYALWQTD